MILKPLFKSRKPGTFPHFRSMLLAIGLIAPVLSGCMPQFSQEDSGLSQSGTAKSSGVVIGSGTNSSSTSSSNSSTPGTQPSNTAQTGSGSATTNAGGTSGTGDQANADIALIQFILD